jgi:O-antigen/teichoic acid export membrane protein
LEKKSIQGETFDLIHGKGELKARVVRSGFWVFAMRIADRVFRLARTIILARLLAPEDFGLFGIALLAISTLETFSQMGFSAALVQKKQDIKLYLDTAWVVQAARGLFLALILFAITPYVANFFDSPASKPILQVIALSVLFGGFSSIGIVYFKKELEYHKLFVYIVAGNLADVGVSICMAFILRNAWALVFGLLAGSVVRMVVSYLIHPYRPRLHFNQKQFKELFGFGKWVLGANIALFLIMQGDDIFVGKLLGITALGFYQFAYKLSNLPATEISHLIMQVTFPAYSKLQDNLPRLRKAYLKVLQITMFLSFPIAGLIFVLAPDFTKIFLGEKWLPMVPSMQVLVFCGLFRSIGATMGPVFQAVGRPDILTKLAFARLAIIVALIYPLSIKWGIAGTSSAVLISSFITMPVAYYITVNRILRGSMPTLFKKSMLVPLISSALMVLLLYFCIERTVSLLGFVPVIVAGIFFYLLLGYSLDKILKYGIIDDVMLMIPKRVRVALRLSGVSANR